MGFGLDLDGLQVQLEIRGYEPADQVDWEDQWCKIDFSLCAGSWLNYCKENDEIMCCKDIECLETALTRLLNNGLNQEEEIEFIEPDFEFVLYPGGSIMDISAEWRVNFWSGGVVMESYLTLVLSRADIVALRDYLVKVMHDR